MSLNTFAAKIRNALRIDRSIIIVWRADKKLTILAILFTLTQGIIPLVSLYILKLIIDTITLAVQGGDPESSFQRIVWLILAATAVAVFQAVLRQAGEYVTEAQANVVTDYVTRIMHEKSLSLDLAYYENPAYYDTLYRAQREGPYRPTRIVNGVTRSLQNMVSLTAMVGLLFSFHYSVGLLLFVSVFPGVIAQIYNARKRFAWQKERTSDERRCSYLSSLITHDMYAKEIRLFDLGRHFSRLHDDVRSILRREKLTLAKNRSLADLGSQVFAVIVLMGCLLFIASNALSGMISLGAMVMYFQAFQRGVDYLKNLLTSIASLYEDNMFVANFFEFLDVESGIRDLDSPMQLPPPKQSVISLENVCFKYPGEREPVLKDVSITINPGEVVALIGRNGAGKSTLVKLLCRLYDPTEGHVFFGGKDYTIFSQKELRERISVVFQDFARYFFTVGENIRLGDVGLPAGSEDIITASQKAGADSFIEQLPHGYDTRLGRWFQDGEELSIGEWQKLVLARAFVRDADLVILDEPTSSLDVNTEYHIYTKFRQLIAGRSALIISHRFSTVKMADRIYVLDDRSIAESGSHEQLMERQGIYAEMYKKQSSWMY